MTTYNASLPGGKVVMLSHVPLPWWNEDNASGYVSPKLLAPDPDQPRKVMRKEDLDELRQSVIDSGVRQNIVVTPRACAPWAKVKPEDEMSPFLIVSGHRRTRVSLESNIEAVPIIIRIYANEEEHRLDGYVLNKQGKELSPLEEGHEIERLHRSGISYAKIAKRSGDTQAYVDGRRYLTRLAPVIQSLIDPGLPFRNRLSLNVASALGSVGEVTREEIEAYHVTFSDSIHTQRGRPLMPYSDVWNLSGESLRFELQKILLSVYLHRKMTAIKGVEFIKERKVMLSSSGHKVSATERFQPARRKAIIASVAQGVCGSTIIDWTPSEFERIFETASYEEVEKYRHAMNQASSMMIDLARLFARIRDSKKMNTIEKTNLKVVSR